MLRFVFSTLRGSRLVLVPLAFVAGGVFGVFGTVAGCSSSSDDAGPLGPKPDSGVALDGGGGSSDASSACAPASVNDFEPNWERPPAWYRGACTRDELNTFNSVCEVNTAAKYYSKACEEFRNSAEHAKCSTCIFETPTPKEQAALLETSLEHRLPNVAACIANATNDFTASGCAAKYQALVQCEIKACTANCPLSPLGDDDFRACTLRAAGGPCKAYQEKVAPCIAADAGPSFRICIDNKSEFQIVEILCGQRLNDGG
ncbi:hypothetical protein LZC95_24670 [Pendulispora brunnea]|uniref:Uncharacterized protein n=1 Tax=Pendulispora brunnea TaxID=2905690 RepID=A0ABZ2KSH5_9BACT